MPNKYDKNQTRDMLEYARKGETLNMIQASWQNVDINAQDNTNGNTALMYMVEQNDSIGLNSLLEFPTIDKNLPNNDDDGPLHRALKKARYDLAETLIKAGANVNQPDGNGNTAVHLIAASGKMEMLRLCLDKGGDPAIKNKDDKNADHLLACNGISNKCLPLVVNARLNQADNDGNTPIFYAVEHNNEYTVNAFINNGADVTVTNNEGERPIDLARRKRKYWVTGPLETAEKTQEMIQAARVNDLDGIFEAIYQGADINGVEPRKHNTALIHMAWHGNESAVVELLTREADPNQRNNDKDSPAHIALLRKNENAFVALMAGGADLNLGNANGLTPVHMVARSGNAILLKQCLEKGGDPHQKTEKEGWNAAHFAASYGRNDALKTIIEAGIETGRDTINQPDSNGNTPIFYAIQNNQGITTQTLIDHGARLYHKNHDGLRPIDVARQQENPDPAIIAALEQAMKPKNNLFDQLKQAVAVQQLNTAPTEIEAIFGAGQPEPVRRWVGKRGTNPPKPPGLNC